MLGGPTACGGLQARQPQAPQPAAEAPRLVPAGAYFVPTAQPLGRLVFALLEPEGFGLARWGVFDRLLGGEFGALSGMVYGSTGVAEFPVWRAVRAPRVAQRALP